MNIYPYVYRLDHPSGEFYIGYRCANRVPAAKDFGHKYKTSSNKLSHPFEEYRQTILAEFYLNSGKNDAYDFEQLTIFENWGDPLLVNERCYHGGLRFSRAGKMVSAESRAKMAEAKRGRKLSAEHRQKMSDSRRGQVRSAESRQKSADARRGQVRSAESRARMVEAQRGKIGKKHSDETKAKISESGLGRKHSAETKQRMSEAQRDRWCRINNTKTVC